VENGAYVYGGYFITFIALGGYALWVTARAKSLEVNLRQARHEVAVAQEQKLGADTAALVEGAVQPVDGAAVAPGVDQPGQVSS